MSLTFGTPRFGAPKKRANPADVLAEFDVDRVRRIAEIRTGTVHPHELDDTERGPADGAPR